MNVHVSDASKLDWGPGTVSVLDRDGFVVLDGVLPPTEVEDLGGPFEVNDDSNTLIDRLYKTCQPASFFSPEHSARLEWRFAEWFSGVFAK
jgi:hypothetical protein